MPLYRGAVLLLVDDAFGEDVLAGIDVPAVDDHFVMEMRAGGDAGIAHQADFLAPLNSLANPHQDLRAMGVAGDQPITVIDGDEFAIPRHVFPYLGHDPAGRRVDAGAHLRGYVDPFVGTGVLVDRVNANAGKAAAQESMRG